MDSNSKLKFWMVGLLLFTSLWTVHGTKARENGHSRIEQMQMKGEDYIDCYGTTKHTPENEANTGRTYFQIPNTYKIPKSPEKLNVKIDGHEKETIFNDNQCYIKNKDIDPEQAKKEFDYFVEKNTNLFYITKDTITCYNFDKEIEKFISEKVQDLISPVTLDFRKRFEWTTEEAIENGPFRLEQMNQKKRDYTDCYGTTGYDYQNKHRTYTYFQVPSSQINKEFENGSTVSIHFKNGTGKWNTVRNTYCNIDNNTDIYNGDGEQARKEFDDYVNSNPTRFDTIDDPIITCYNFSEEEKKFLQDQVESVLTKKLQFRKRFEWTTEKSIKNGPFRLEQMKEKKHGYTDCYGTTGFMDEKDTKRTYFQVPNSQINKEFENGSTVLVQFNDGIEKSSYVRNTYCNINKESEFKVYEEAPQDQAQNEFYLYQKQYGSRFHEENNGKVDHIITCYNFNDDEQRFLTDQIARQLVPAQFRFMAKE